MQSGRFLMLLYKKRIVKDIGQSLRNLNSIFVVPSPDQS